MNKENIPLYNLTKNVSHLNKRMGQNFSRGYLNATIEQENKILKILTKTDLIKNITLQNYPAHLEKKKSNLFDISHRGNKMYCNNKKEFGMIVVGAEPGKLSIDSEIAFLKSLHSHEIPANYGDQKLILNNSNNRNLFKITHEYFTDAGKIINTKGGEN